ncbi:MULTISPECIES: cell adhesion protein [unclassified Oleiphilus]|nr:MULTISPECIES: cell adhesion protein [unclassified Oleiphilus]KZY66752.1 cell adhesion protein [Oleiphilus sp. HI0066]KZY70215.1 cell adhesion protein [Oleiphilus sp. HI0067]
MTKTIQKFLSFSVLIFSSSFAAAAQDTLDYGLYWFDENNTSVKAIEQDGTVNNVSLNYFDPTKSTIIHFHGWQNGSSQNNYSREDFLFDYNGENVITSASWKARDWNIAYFYWNQLADEAEVKDAEAKIWTPNGPRGMRYRLNDGSYSTALSPNKSVSDIAFEQITSVLSGSTSYYVRLSGHSLGSQLATNVTKKISDAVYNGTVGNNLTVDRLELLDPFWSADPKSYLGDANGDGNTDWVGEHARWDIQTLIDRHNLPVTWYKSSGILDIWIGDRNTILEGMVTFIHNRFWYLSGPDFVNKHNHVVPWYFRSMASNAPEEVTITWWGARRTTGKLAASARTSDSRIQEMMGDRYHWDQVEGRYTTDPSDDQFERKNY